MPFDRRKLVGPPRVIDGLPLREWLRRRIELLETDPYLGLDVSTVTRHKGVYGDGGEHHQETQSARASDSGDDGQAGAV